MYSNVLTMRSDNSSQDQDAFSGVKQPTESRRILLVDDEEAIRQICAETLARYGYHVDTAGDGETGWEMLNAASFDSDAYDLLITDNNMPKLSGFDLVKRLRLANIELPVIMASGMVSVSRMDTESLGLAAVLAKPFFPRDLIDTVKRVLNET